MADEIDIIVSATDNFSSVLGNFGNIMTGIKSTLDLVGQAFNAAYDFGSQFVDAAASSETAMTQLDTVFKSAGASSWITIQGLDAMSVSMQNLTGNSDEAEKSAEAMLLRYENLTGDVFPQALQITNDLSASLGIDLTSAARMVGMALDDPTAGVGRLNTQFRIFDASQLEVIKHMAETGDVAGAQALIIQGLTDKFGGAADAIGNTFTGKLNIAKETLDNLKETIGGAFLPVLSQLLDEFTAFANTPDVNQFFIDFSKIISDFLTVLSSGDVVGAINNLGKSISELLPPQVVQIINDFGGLFAAGGALAIAVPILTTLAGALLDVGAQIAAFAPEAAAAPMLTFFLSLVDIIGPLNAIILPIVGTIAAFAGGMDLLSQATGGLIPKLSELTQGVLDWVKSFDWQKFSDQIVAGIQSIDWAQVGQEISKNLGIILDIIGTVLIHIDWGEVLSAFGKAFANFVAGIAGFSGWADMANEVSTVLKYEFDKSIGAWFSNLGSNLNSYWQYVKGYIVAIGADIVNGLQAGFTGQWSTWWASVVDFFTRIIDGIETILQIASPSTVFADIGKNIVLGLIQGWNITFDAFVGAIKTDINSIISLFPDWLQNALGIGGASASGLGTASGGTTSGTAGGGTGSGTNAGSGGNVVNNYYAPVYFQGGTEPGSYYDCPSPNPFTAAGSGTIPANAV